MTPSPATDATDRECMTRAVFAASTVRCVTSPNPWVGAVLRTPGGQMFEGATRSPGASTPRSSRSTPPATPRTVRRST